MCSRATTAQWSASSACCCRPSGRHGMELLACRLRERPRTPPASQTERQTDRQADRRRQTPEPPLFARCALSSLAQHPGRSSKGPGITPPRTRSGTATRESAEASPMISSRLSSRQGKSVWRRPPVVPGEEPAEAGPTLPSIYKQVPRERKTAVSTTLHTHTRGAQRAGSPGWLGNGCSARTDPATHCTTVGRA